MPVDMKVVIGEAFKKMVQKGDVDKVTVKSLIEVCHISRQTFYYHFQDIMDVMEWAIRQETQRLIEQSLKMDDLQSALKIFISFTMEQFSIIQKIMNSQRRPQFEIFLIDSMETYLMGLSPFQEQKLSADITDWQVLLRYNACGLVGILLTYGGKSDLDQDQLAAQLERILFGEVQSWVVPS